MGCTWFKVPVAWGAERSDVVINEDILVFGGIDFAKGRLHCRETPLQAIQMTDLEGLRLKQDIGKSCDEMSL